VHEADEEVGREKMDVDAPHKPPALQPPVRLWVGLAVSAWGLVYLTLFVLAGRDYENTPVCVCASVSYRQTN